VHTGFWWGNLRKQTARRDLGVYVQKILNESLKCGMGNGLDWSGLGGGQVAGFYECVNEHPGPIIYGKCLD
jgi:hypothetical protein